MLRGAGVCEELLLTRLWSRARPPRPPKRCSIPFGLKFLARPEPRSHHLSPSLPSVPAPATPPQPHRTDRVPWDRRMGQGAPREPKGADCPAAAADSTALAGSEEPGLSGGGCVRGAGCRGSPQAPPPGPGVMCRVGTGSAGKAGRGVCTRLGVCPCCWEDSGGDPSWLVTQGLGGRPHSCGARGHLPSAAVPAAGT